MTLSPGDRITRGLDTARVHTVTATTVTLDRWDYEGVRRDGALRRVVLRLEELEGQGWARAENLHG